MANLNPLGNVPSRLVWVNLAGLPGIALVVWLFTSIHSCQIQNGADSGPCGDGALILLYPPVWIALILSLIALIYDLSVWGNKVLPNKTSRLPKTYEKAAGMVLVGLILVFGAWWLVWGRFHG